MAFPMRTGCVKFVRYCGIMYSNCCYCTEMNIAKVYGFLYTYWLCWVCKILWYKTIQYNNFVLYQKTIQNNYGIVYSHHLLVQSINRRVGTRHGRSSSD